MSCGVSPRKDWQADNITIFENHDERSRALGTSDPSYIISFWWD
jgi:hypothetical protein